jgi:hypothetical protein
MPILVFLEGLGTENFGVFHGHLVFFHLVHFMAILHFCGHFGIFFHIGLFHQVKSCNPVVESKEISTYCLS